MIRIYEFVFKNEQKTIDDVDFQPKWNAIDGKIDRTTFHGEYKIHNKYPLNVAGRTGISGRGLLGRWGVNHAGLDLDLLVPFCVTC